MAARVHGVGRRMHRLAALNRDDQPDQLRVPGEVEIGLGRLGPVIAMGMIDPDDPVVGAAQITVKINEQLRIDLEAVGPSAAVEIGAGMDGADLEIVVGPGAPGKKAATFAGIGGPRQRRRPA